MNNNAKDLADKLPALASKQMEADMSETEARLYLGFLCGMCGYVDVLIEIGDC